MNYNFLTKKHLSKFIENDNFSLLASLIKKLPKVSFLFVTYNRCPSADFNLNPLTWAFQTLIANKFCFIDQYVVVDDCSTDYTYKNIKWIEEKYKINIKYIKNKKHKEYSYNRRRGIKYVKNNLVFMGDDDCLYSQYFVVGSLLTYYFLKNKTKVKNLAVINLPVYERSIVPRLTVDYKMIGKILFNKTFFYHNFDKFPKNYLNKAEYLDDYKLIIAPLKVDTFSGVNLCDKNLILKAGNYLDLSMWQNGYSEHIELSYKLFKKEYVIYHQPDPKISCLHLKYGALSKDKFSRHYQNYHFSGLKYNLGRLIDESTKENLNTGARCSNQDFHIIEIGTLFSFYLKISKELGLKFAIKEYKNFVNKGIIFSTTPSELTKSKEVRRTIWEKAIKKGCLVTQKQTGENYNNLCRKIINRSLKL